MSSGWRSSRSSPRPSATGSSAWSTTARPRRGCASCSMSARRWTRRVRVEHRAENGGIVAASNTALAMATGEFVALLDHDDRLHPDALALVNEALLGAPEADYVYTDEDKMTAKGHHAGAVPEARLVAGADADADVHLPPERAAALAGRGGRRVRSRLRGGPGLGPGPEGDRAGAGGPARAADPLPLARDRGLDRGGGRGGRRRDGEAVGVRSGGAGDRRALRADRGAGDGRARSRRSRRLSPESGPADGTAGQHRDPDQRPEARNPLPGGHPGRALRAQHRRPTRPTGTSRSSSSPTRTRRPRRSPRSRRRRATACGSSPTTGPSASPRRSTSAPSTVAASTCCC